MHVRACLRRMDEVIVHIGCTSLKESQELVGYLTPALQLEIHLIIVNLRVKYNVKLMCEV